MVLFCQLCTDLHLDQASGPQQHDEFLVGIHAPQRKNSLNTNLLSSCFYTLLLYLWVPGIHVTCEHLMLKFIYCNFFLICRSNIPLYVVMGIVQRVQIAFKSNHSIFVVSLISSGIAKLSVIISSLQKISCISRLYSRLHHSWQPVIFKSCLSSKTPGSLLSQCLTLLICSPLFGLKKQSSLSQV